MTRGDLAVDVLVGGHCPCPMAVSVPGCDVMVIGFFPLILAFEQFAQLAMVRPARLPFDELSKLMATGSAPIGRALSAANLFSPALDARCIGRQERTVA